jgi:hypothetical protein
MNPMRERHFDGLSGSPTETNQLSLTSLERTRRWRAQQLFGLLPAIGKTQRRWLPPQPSSAPSRAAERSVFPVLEPRGSVEFLAYPLEICGAVALDAIFERSGPHSAGIAASVIHRQKKSRHWAGRFG